LSGSLRVLLFEMKKFLIPVVLGCGFVAIGMALLGPPLFLKLFTGQSRILLSTTCEVKINGETDAEKICFHADEYFHGGSADLIVIYDQQERSGYHPVTIVDRSRHDAGIPNSSMDDYRAVGRWLIVQSESGALIVPYGGAKIEGDPKYIFQPGYVKFERPVETGTQIEIVELYTPN
jgi:hypothetical protein